MRGALLRLLRATRLIQFVDYFAARRAANLSAQANASYLAANPDRAFPDAALVYEVSAQAHLQTYDASGQAHAREIAAYLNAANLGEAPNILDWGCGPGRVLAHLPAHLPGAHFHGCDPNPRAIAFGRSAFPGIAFARSALTPPAPYADKTFDAIYGISILTHLPQSRADAWLAELARIVRDHGVVVLTAHGAAATSLSQRERARFDDGAYIERAGADIGSRTYVSYFNEAAGRRLFAPRFADVACHPPGAGATLGHDIWVLRAPTRR